MRVPYCHICDSNPDEKERYGASGLDEGEYCPVCQRPYCKYHGAIVRWRWKDSRALDSGKVCRACKNAYLHRTWDPVRREWIS